MSLVFVDRVEETSTTTGTGSYALGGAVPGYQQFSAVGNANTCYYCAVAVDSSGVPTGSWETGIGTYTASGPTLSRNTIFGSSNSGAAVSWSAGTKRISLSRIAQSGNIVAANIATAETTSSTSYTDLATVGPAVTLNTNTDVIAWISCTPSRAGTGFTANASIAISGATTLAAADANSVAFSEPSSGFSTSISRCILLSGLTPGSNTFTMKYVCNGGGPWTFQWRSLAVMAL